MTPTGAPEPDSSLVSTSQNAPIHPHPLIHSPYPDVRTALDLENFRPQVVGARRAMPVLRTIHIAAPFLTAPTAYAAPQVSDSLSFTHPPQPSQ